MELHFMIEILCGIIGFVIFLLSWSLYKENKKDFLFWFSMWGLILGSLTIFNVMTSYFPLFNIPNNKWIPFTYLPERIGSSLIAMFCVYPPAKKINTIFFLIIGYIILIYIFISSNIIGIREGIIGRPQELIQIIIAAIVFGRLTDTVTTWGKILKYGTLSTLIGGVIMIFSSSLYDPCFNAAHIFKLLSYMFMFFAIIYLRSYIWLAEKEENWLHDNIGWMKIKHIISQQKKRN